MKPSGHFIPRLTEQDWHSVLIVRRDFLSHLFPCENIKKKKKSNPTSRAWIGQSPLASCKRNDTNGNEVDWWWLTSLSIISEKSVGINRDQCLPWEAATGTMPLPLGISSLESGKIGQRHYLYIFKWETESILQGTLFKWEIGSGFFKVNCSSINRSQEYSFSIDSDRNNVV